MSITITSNATGRWQFSIDRGGTFTDVIGIDPGGRLHPAKLLSDSPSYPDAAILGLHFCRDTVQSYGGEVGLDTEVGRGTTVTVYLPKAVV
ncbi:MAG: hypothetical protein GH143_01480 [Calditrichaeota bacterium]|nr:hypothetical protein [Calditrichota bacterium]